MIAVDGGAPAARAAATGCALAEALGASVTLFHAVEPAPYAAGLVRSPDESSRLARTKGQEIFAPMLAQLPQAIEILELAEIGEAAKSILGAAWEWSADLLVIGSHGRDGVMRAVLGSVAEAVMRHAACPVLVVRAAPSAPARASKGRAGAL